MLLACVYSRELESVSPKKSSIHLSRG